VQEEPENMGAWSYWKTRFGNRLLDRYPLDVVARPASASPATVPAALTSANKRSCWSEPWHDKVGHVSTCPNDEK